MKNLHFTTVKHRFFSNSMILIDLVKNGSLLWNMAYMAHSDPLDDFPLKVM